MDDYCYAKLATSCQRESERESTENNLKSGDEDVQQLIGRPEELPPQLVESFTLKQETPQPPCIKKEEEELCITQEGECLLRPQEAGLTRFPLTVVFVKTEDDEEKPQVDNLLAPLSDSEAEDEAEEPLSIKTNSEAPHHGERLIHLPSPATALNMQRVTQGMAVPPRLPPPPAPALNMWQTEEPGSRLAYRPTWRGGRMADNISCSAAEVQILSLLETIKHTQDQLMAKVNFLTSRLTSTPGPEFEMPANIQFPLDELEAVEAFEEFLKEPSNDPARQRVISSLATFGGKDVKRVTWNILGRIFTDDVSHQINWKGVNNKKAFSRMATKTLLFSAVRKTVVTRSATDAEVTKHAIRWFNLAADRAARRRVPPPPPPPPPQRDQEE